MSTIANLSNVDMTDHYSMMDINKNLNKNSSLYQQCQAYQPNLGSERLIIGIYL